MLSIIPMLGVFRTFRVVRNITLLRRRGPEQMAMDVDRGRAQATFLITVFLVLIVVEFAGMAIFLVESANPDSNIKNASDAIWWGFVTVTTVGYGDRYPVTDAGRVIGTILLFAGIALFSVLTGFIANGFLCTAIARSPAHPRPEGFAGGRRGGAPLDAGGTGGAGRGDPPQAGRHRAPGEGSGPSAGSRLSEESAATPGACVAERRCVLRVRRLAVLSERSRPL